jgi:hypothetical protein
MEVSIREYDKAAILGTGVFTGLFFTHERIFVLRLGFQNNEWEAFCIEEKKVNEPF